MKTKFRNILRWFKKNKELALALGVIAALITNIDTILDFVEKHFTKPQLHLSLSIQSWDLDKESGKTVGHKEFESTDINDLFKQSAVWVKSTLDQRFPRNDEYIQVTASVDAGHLVVKPADPLRQDRFWLFGSDTAKEGHFHPRDAKEAIESTAQTLLLHVDRPGYDLRLIQLAIKGQPQTVTISRLPEPSLTVIVDSLAGNEAIAEQFRAKLRDLNLVVGSPDIRVAKKRAYEESRKPGLSNDARLAHLRAARIDAFISGSYTRASKDK
jgi:hypothetical protein